MLAFAEIADGIGRKEDLHLLDRHIAQAIIPYVTPASAAFFAAVTWLGAGVFLTVLGVAVGIFLLVKRETLRFYAWVLALAGSGLLNVTLKSWYMRDRPGDLPLLASWSFPSAHAMNSLVAYGMLIYVLSRFVGRRWMPAAIAAAATVVLLVAASRVMLGFHYFTDVLGGTLAGFAWLAVCITLCEAAQAHRVWINRRRSPRP